MSKRKAISAGHICIDITPIFPEVDNGSVSKILTPGKLINMNGVNIHTGGSVANTGLAMKILGADVTLMGKLGNDELGSMILDILKNYDADSGMIVADNEQSSYSVVIAMPGIDRIFLHDPGANDTFSYEDFDFEMIKDTDLFHFGYPTLMKKMYENDGQELVRIFRRIHENGTAISLDMSAVDPLSPAGKVDWKSILEKLLPYVDFFVPSVEELCFMIDRDRYDEWLDRADGRDITDIIALEDVKPLAQKAIDMGVSVTVIKCGAPGMYYKTSSNNNIVRLCDKLGLLCEEWCDKEGFEKSYVPDKVLSATGAGDTSIAAFLTTVLDGKSLKEALQMATATGACCVTAYDALSGLKSLPELKNKIANGWLKNS